MQQSLYSEIDNKLIFRILAIKKLHNQLINMNYRNVKLKYVPGDAFSVLFSILDSSFVFRLENSICCYYCEAQG